MINRRGKFITRFVEISVFPSSAEVSSVGPLSPTKDPLVQEAPDAPEPAPETERI